jgi:ABC-type transport system involved in multi-copper enzyme maturation permease subunit
MLAVDFRRMFKSLLVWILIASCLVAPIVITVMIEMMEGTIPTNPQTGEPGEPIKGFDSAWQIIGSVRDMEAMGNMSAGGAGGAGGASGMAAMEMDVTSMCNINMLYFFIAVLVCLFISDDFRSGYAKNLFTVRAKRGEYVISKTLAGVVCGALMLVAYLLGSILGGAIAGLSFDLHGLGAGNLVACMLAKICLMPVFVSIFTLISVAAKQRAWLSICGSLGGGMLLFMMVSIITPLGSTLLNVALCAAGGALFGLGLGAISRVVLRKSGLV